MIACCFWSPIIIQRNGGSDVDVITIQAFIVCTYFFRPQNVVKGKMWPVINFTLCSSPKLVYCSFWV